jgi:excisionase family DNA binding protein
MQTSARSQAQNCQGVTMQEQTAKTPILVAKTEAAKLLGVCTRTIDNLVARKELPCRRIGRRTLIPYSALLAFARHDH